MFCKATSCSTSCTISLGNQLPMKIKFQIENEDALITINYNNLEIQNTEMIGDSTVVGMAILNNSIYLSYRDRRIEKFKDL